MRKVGGVVASPYNAMRLLEQDELVAVFPEGVKGRARTSASATGCSASAAAASSRSRCARARRSCRSRSSGSEEIYPKLGESACVARLIGAPYFPITPTFPLLGPLGAIPLPSKWRIEFCEPIATARYGPEAAEDRALVFELSERVRDEIQQARLREPRQEGSGVHLGGAARLHRTVNPADIRR